MNTVAEKAVNLSHSSQKKMQSTGKLFHIDVLWSDPLPTVMESMINQKYIGGKS